MSSTTTHSLPSTPARGLHVALWGVQGLLGLAFLLAGVMKSTQPIETLGQNMPWALAVPPALVRVIGVSELLGALGLVLPSALRVAPKLTPLAAAGLVLVMALAGAFHATRGELGALPINLVLGGLAAFVAWGRLQAAPIAGR